MEWHCADWKDEICDEFEGIETTENIEFFTENVETPKMQVPAEIQDNLVDAIYACHDGVLRMAPSMPEIVETSSNLAIVEIGDGKAAIKILARSSHEYYKMYLATMVESCFNMAGMKALGLALGISCLQLLLKQGSKLSFSSTNMTLQCMILSVTKTCRKPSAISCEISSAP